MPHPHLPELDELQRVIALGGAHLHVTTQPLAGHPPLYTVALGNPSRDVPAVGFFGGVHGLERIGSQVVIAYLHALVTRLRWDASVHALLEQVRLVFMPVVNPGGMLRHTRANPNGVDLMRNAPVDAREPVPFLVGGQRISAGLPWYRGRAGMPMEAESAALCALVETELHGRPFSLALDCHSGYGWGDSIWFPYARTRRLMRHLPEMYALKMMLEEAHPHHGYSFEPQSHQYLLHGDLWDCAYDRVDAQNTFLPMTLELGSWLWIRKNPRQLFTRHGIFNPIKEHRTRRVLRRHEALLDLLTRAAFGAPRWLPQGARRERLGVNAMEYWGPRPRG